MDRKRYARHLGHHAIAMLHTTDPKRFRKHARIVAYITERSRHGLLIARWVSNWMLLKLAVRSHWNLWVVLPFLRRFRPKRYEQIMKVARILRLARKL